MTPSPKEICVNCGKKEVNPECKYGMCYECCLKKIDHYLPECKKFIPKNTQQENIHLQAEVSPHTRTSGNKKEQGNIQPKQRDGSKTVEKDLNSKKSFDFSSSGSAENNKDESKDEEIFKEDPLDKLILNEEQSKYFNLGKERGKRETINKSRDIVEKEFKGKIKDLTKENKVLKIGFHRLEKDRDYWKKKVGWTEEREIKLEKEIEKLKLANAEERQNLLGIIEVAYNKCSEGLENIKRERPREDNTPRDWEQRLDELILIYSDVKHISYNEAKEELKSKMQERT